MVCSENKIESKISTWNNLNMPKLINENCWLIPIEDLSCLESSETNERLEMLETAKVWVKDYLCGPHEMLGRAGVVCPFVPKSIKAKMVWLSLLPENLFDDVNLLHYSIKDYAAWFQRLEPVASEDKIFILVMPTFNASKHADLLFQRIQDLQIELSNEGLSIAPFFHGNPATGLRSDAFRPGESTIPLIAIRKTTAHDLPFIMRNQEKEDALSTYFAKFAPSLPLKVREELVRLLSSIQTQS
mgnify:CR=1 FL=1